MRHYHLRQDWLTLAALLLCSAGTSQGIAQTDTGVIASGRVIRTGNVMQIGTAASGVVAELLAHDGTSVEKGQPLARLECGDVEKQVGAEKSQLAAVEAGLTRLQNGSRAEEIAIATANLVLARAQADQASTALRRISPDDSTVSQEQIEKAQRDDTAAAAGLDEARAKLALLQAGSRPEDISQAEFLRDEAKAHLDEAMVRLERCTVRAPASGVVIETRVSLGQFISMAVPQPLFTMIDSDKHGIRAEVEERDLGKICVGQHAVATAPSFPGVQREGTVVSLGDAVGPRTTSNAAQPGKDEVDVRTVLVSLADAKVEWPVGLKVSLRFQPCAPTR